MVLKEYDYNQGIDMKEILASLSQGHSQLGNLSQAINLLNQIQETRSKDPEAKLVLGYTSNMISSGMREVIRFLCEKKMVDAVVTSCGGIEEDFIKCQNHFFRGKFFNDDFQLRMNGINRTGNMFVPNKNYIDFEEFLLPIVKQMERDIRKHSKVYTSSMIIKAMAKKINNEESIYYWCYKNNIKMFCPGITDGSVGDVLFFQSYKFEHLKIDIMADHFELNDLVRNASKAYAFVIGGGFVKHWVLQAGQNRNGYDSVILINDGLQYDHSDSGKGVDFEIKRGYLKDNKKHIKVFAEASLVLPIVVQQILNK